MGLKRKSGLSALMMMSALLGASSGLGAIMPNEPDHSERDSKRMDLTTAERAKLASLSGKEKKRYVKELRASKRSKETT